MSEAAIFIAEAERVIVHANPPAPLGRGKVVLREDDLSQSTLRNMRQAGQLRPQRWRRMVREAARPRPPSLRGP